MQAQTAKSTILAQRKSTRALSEKVAAALEARATSAPLVVSGISPGKLQTISPKAFARLDVDPRYQRGRTVMVNDLVRALQAGGQVLDPVTLCRRPWEDGEKLWIIDGHQRVCAFQQLGMPFESMVHESANIESEQRFFLSLNARRVVSGDVIVKSWTGASAKLIVAANEDQNHPLYQRVHFGQGAARSQLGASILVRGAATAASGKMHGGHIQKQLARLDHALKEQARAWLAEHYLRLFGSIYTNTTTSSFIAIRLGLVAWERWVKDHVTGLPPQSVMGKLRAVDWKHEYPALNQKYSPAIMATIQRIWKV